MSLRSTTGGVALLAFATASLAIACSNAGSPSATDDGGVTGPGPDANGEGDGASGQDGTSPDAAPPDAALPACSKDHFCRDTLPDSQLLRGVWGDGQGVVWAVSSTGGILRNDGTAWAVHTSSTTDAYLAIWGTSPTNIWVGGSAGLLHGTGSSSSDIVFAAVDVPGDTSLAIRAIWGASADDFWAVGGDTSAFTGRVVHATSGAFTLDDDASSLGTTFTAVWGTPSSGVWIAGNQGDTSGLGVYRKAPGGDSFVSEDLPSAPVGAAYANPYRFDSGTATADKEVFVLGAAKAGGFFGKVAAAAWKGTSDDGQTFTWALLPTLNADFVMTSIWGSSSTDVWSTGQYGRLSHWDGATWTEASLSVTSLPFVTPLYGLWGATTADFWVVGDNVAFHKHPTNSP